ncbi:hypothetical protein EG329_011016 [Mollisiaceae sp. DMI_Dod_QoI]|nr:hypothetical protein EG329_011016 [Helotiales sp. DMI_Dod_QoI]
MAKSTTKRALRSQSKKSPKSKAGVRKHRRRRPNRARKSKSSSSHDYAPLQHADSIRLLVLHPGEFTSPIQISLAEVRLEKDPAYKALSYTWATEDGDNKRSSQVRCENARIWVTKNCELALRYLRREESNRVLWVDAICINQDDKKERGHQVGIMQNVYSRATEVLVWLGESSKILGAQLPSIHSAEPETPDFESHLGLTPSITSNAEPYSSEVNESNGQKDFGIPKSVTEIFFKFLDRMVSETRSMDSAGQDPISSPLYQRLLSEIYSTVHDPRDKIFGILGLSDKRRSLVSVPDYNQTIPEAFTAVTIGILQQTKSLSILEEATSTVSLLHLPSWVPNWSASNIIYFWGGEFSRAAKGSEAMFKVSSDEQVLMVKGQEFDRIEKIPLADPMAYALNTKLAHRIEGWRISCDVGFSLMNYPTGEPVEEAVWRALCWNVDLNSKPAPNKLEDSFREWYHILKSAKSVKECVEKIFDLRAKQTSFERCINITSPLCTTAKGYLAAVPHTTEVGDCIVVLAGAEVPYVLRPTGDHCRFIGPCYVHGIMDGEAFPENPDDLTWYSIH